MFSSGASSLCSTLREEGDLTTPFFPFGDLGEEGLWGEPGVLGEPGALERSEVLSERGVDTLVPLAASGLLGDDVADDEVDASEEVEVAVVAVVAVVVL